MPTTFGVALLLAGEVRSQGAFQNLSFNQVELVDFEPSGPGVHVWKNAVPGWMATSSQSGTIDRVFSDPGLLPLSSTIESLATRIVQSNQDSANTRSR